MSEHHIDFLSKAGVVWNRYMIINRKISRGIISGNVTYKISKNFTIGMFNWCITTSIESWGFSTPGIVEYLRLRKRDLDHTLPSKMSI